MNTSNVNSPKLSAMPETGKSKGKDRKSVEEEASEFQGELAQAGSMSAPRHLPETPKTQGQMGSKVAEKGNASSETMPNGKGMDLKPEISAAAMRLNQGMSGNLVQAKAAQSNGPGSETFLANSERFPEIQKTAASLNTGTAIAGLKPWSKDWVFEGRADNGKGQAIQPLFAPSQPDAPGSLAELEQMISAAAAQAGMQNASGGTEGAVTLNPGIRAGKTGAKGAEEMESALRTLRSGAGVTASGQDVVNAADLSGQMTGMNGNFEIKTSKGPVQMNKAHANGGVSALSGAEFLTTLNAVRDGSSSSGQSGQYGGSGESGQQGSGQQGSGRDERQVRTGLGSRPDFRVIEGGAREKGRKAEFGEGNPILAGADALALNRTVNGGPGRPPMEVTGHVTQGANAQNRLSSESLMGLSSGIRDLKAQGGGEIRIRLKPENLGELHLRVVTQGNNVGLHIQASDTHAKKIIEETMNHLKDSLASQNMHLGRVDLTVAPPTQGTGSDFGNQDQGQSQLQNQQAWQDSQGSWQGGQQGRSERWDGGERDAYQNVSKPGVRQVAARTSAYDANQRLDVMA